MKKLLTVLSAGGAFCCIIGGSVSVLRTLHKGYFVGERQILIIVRVRYLAGYQLQLFGRGLGQGQLCPNSSGFFV